MEQWHSDSLICTNPKSTNFELAVSEKIDM